jgi:hypothetical protein
MTLLLFQYPDKRDPNKLEIKAEEALLVSLPVVILVIVRARILQLL